jgi:acyl-CoA synthetase (AMP-forming)/AMP-acid ligase II
LADFHAFVTAQPSACALVHHDRDAGSSIQLTYRDLADMAVAAGLGLHEAGLHRGCPIVSFCDESPAVVIAFLGIASAGGVVVPIDPAAPEARLQSMIADCGARLAHLQPTCHMLLG